MATEGQTVIVPPGGLPPKAPSGFHWVMIRQIFSDTGGATEWQLVKNAADADDFVQGLRTDLLNGLLSLFSGLGGIGAAGLGIGASQTAVFVFTTLNKQTWVPPIDGFIIGFLSMISSSALTRNASYLNWSTIASAGDKQYNDVIILGPSAASFQLGYIREPITKGESIFVLSNGTAYVNIFYTARTQAPA